MGKETKIKFKRKGSTNNNNVSLSQGEPFYNVADKHLYVGNEDGKDLNGRKHIAEVTVSEGQIQIGEDPNNKFSIKISTETATDGKTYVKIGDDDKNKIALDIATRLEWQEFE